MRAWLLCLAVAGCAAAPPVLPQAPIPLRNPTAPVASQSDATLARLAGDWRVVSAAGLSAASMRIGSETVEIGGVVLSLSQIAPGRFEMGGEEVWVHWLDADDRTAAMGEPGGARVWIMDRTGAPGERLRAAREILAWYGYDLTRMARR